MEILILILIGLYYLMYGYLYFMIATIILGWIPGIRESRFYQIMDKITSFYMGRFRGLLVFGMMDFTPILGFIVYQLAMFGLGQLISFIG
ncbi:MAG TPA: YggT family protein [Bacilli bacterium]|nr:YggT family protein [Bacilli bacterium]